MYEPYIISSAEAKMNITHRGQMFDIVTGVQLSISRTQDVQEIFAIGRLEPIAKKVINKRFTGNMSLQTGEYETILDAINASITTGFISSLTDLGNFSIGWTLEMTGLIVPRTIIYSLDSCAISSDDFSVDRNSPEIFPRNSGNRYYPFSFTALTRQGR